MATGLPFIIAAVALAATSVPARAQRIEAESGQLAGGARVMTDHPGYSGQGFVAGFEAAGAQVQLEVRVPTAGTRTMTLRYANALNGRDQIVAVYVNGAKAADVVCPVLPNWDTWGTATVTIALNSGANAVAIRNDSGDSGVINIDYLTIQGPPGGK